MLISIIAAVARNGVIGRNGALPWHLPADLKYFKTTTMGKPVIMGRRTWESIGKPLPGRLNVVVTSHPGVPVTCARATSLAQAIRLAESDEAFIIGGARLFAEALPLADRLYLTLVDAEIEGDVSFPAYDRTAWREVKRAVHVPDDKNPYRLTFSLFERKI